MLNRDGNDGFLIDLDLAIKLENIVASGAPSKTGTRIFMAIGALHGDEHNFMHDLESFFWVLLWMCMHWNGPGKDDTKSKLESWNFLDIEDLVRSKIGFVSKQLFLKNPPEFTSYCFKLRKCVQELHGILFPDYQVWEFPDKKAYSDMQRVLKIAAEELE